MTDKPYFENKAQELAFERIQKLTLGPNDLIIVRTEDDMRTLLEMTQQGIGFSPFENPVLLIRGGLEKATEADLEDALRIIREHNRIATEIIRRVN